MKGISEKLSENTKRRGRLKSFKARVIEDWGPGLQIEGCQRTKMNDAYRLSFMGVVIEADPADFKAIMGHTEDEMNAGEGKFPIGYKTAATEIGRYMEAAAADGEEIVEIVVDARTRGISWAGIAAHFRNLRLGERRGTVTALTAAIIPTINEYQRRFPGMTVEQIRVAIQRIKTGSERGYRAPGRLGALEGTKTILRLAASRGFSLKVRYQRRSNSLSVSLNLSSLLLEFGIERKAGRKSIVKCLFDIEKGADHVKKYLSNLPRIAFCILHNTFDQVALFASAKMMRKGVNGGMSSPVRKAAVNSMQFRKKRVLIWKQIRLPIVNESVIEGSLLYLAVVLLQEYLAECWLTVNLMGDYRDIDGRPRQIVCLGNVGRECGLCCYPHALMCLNPTLTTRGVDGR